ncbi:Uncharacterised protein [Mycobacteroides abscessus subsp. abscessus]|nr:Uncharacterised protein [Mycobacteroides abscessus subsp. abscessus]
MVVGELAACRGSLSRLRISTNTNARTTTTAPATEAIRSHGLDFFCGPYGSWPGSPGYMGGTA